MSTDLPDEVLSRLARRKVALELVGTPISPSVARHLETLKYQDRGSDTLVFHVETKRALDRHTPETAVDVVDTLHRFQRQDKESASTRGVRGITRLRKRVETELDGGYDEEIEVAKAELRDAPPLLELAAYCWS